MRTNAPYPDWVEGCRCDFDTVGTFDGYGYDCPHHATEALVCSVAGDGQHDPGVAPWERSRVACTKCGQELAPDHPMPVPHRG